MLPPIQDKLTINTHKITVLPGGVGGYAGEGVKQHPICQCTKHVKWVNFVVKTSRSIFFPLIFVLSVACYLLLPPLPLPLPLPLLLLLRYAQIRSDDNHQD